MARVRLATAHDTGFIEDMLVEAASWDPSRPRISRDETLRRPGLRRYVDGWPRENDVGVVVEDEQGRRLGAAWYRFFSSDDPGYGFVSEDIPEASIAMVPDSRGRGLGDLLLAELEHEARRRGVRALSLSVEPANRAVNLYRRRGYREVGRSGGSHTMVLWFA
jgi:GNAT superfamily N-acetyltransferase